MNILKDVTNESTGSYDWCGIHNTVCTFSTQDIIELPVYHDIQRYGNIAIFTRTEILPYEWCIISYTIHLTNFANQHTQCHLETLPKYTVQYLTQSIDKDAQVPSRSKVQTLNGYVVLGSVYTYEQIFKISLVKYICTCTER